VVKVFGAILIVSSWPSNRCWPSRAVCMNDLFFEVKCG
jgi:hypothetical protein